MFYGKLMYDFFNTCFNVFVDVQECKACKTLRSHCTSQIGFQLVQRGNAVFHFTASNRKHC